MASDAERQIRKDVEAWCTSNLHDYRVLHELPVGGCRADLAAIGSDHIILFELKSERDTLSRLPEQVRQFGRAAHCTVVVAAHRWFSNKPYDDGKPRLAWEHERPSGVEIWAHPEPDGKTFPYHQWRIPAKDSSPLPHPLKMLEILWRDELADAASRCGIVVKSREPAPKIMRRMYLELTGRQNIEAVCKQLRLRSTFSETVARIRSANP